jgi:hypothetical protein
MKRFFTSFTFIFACLFALNAQTIIHSETFNTSAAISWIVVNSGGPTDTWTFPSSGTPVNGYALINGFADEDDLDWLISPAINMDNTTGETFSFKTKNRYPGATTGVAPTINLELKYTTNYITGDPVNTVWTTITMPETVASSNITTTTLSAQTPHLPFDISFISGTNVRFAFRYYGLATASKEWQIDDIVIATAAPCSECVVGIAECQYSEFDLDGWQW